MVQFSSSSISKFHEIAMKNIFLFTFFVCSLSGCSGFGQNRSGEVPQIEHTDTLHGVVIRDPFKWMEDLSSPKLMRFIRAENRNMRKAIRKTRKLHREFFQEVNNRQIVSWAGEELYDRPDGEYIYYTRNGGHYRKKRNGSEMEQLLIDEKELAEDYELWSFELSPNRQHIAYVIFHEDTENWHLHLKHIDSNTITEFPNVFEFVWVNDSTIIYSTDNEELDRIKRLYMHKLGTPHSTDQIIYEEPDKSSYLISVELSKSRRYIFAHIAILFTVKFCANKKKSASLWFPNP